jgi:hypothetical protein
MPTLEDILQQHDARIEEPDPRVIPAECGFGQHVWPATWQNGDTCQCGTLYATSDGARLCVSEW